MKRLFTKEFLDIPFSLPGVFFLIIGSFVASSAIQTVLYAIALTLLFLWVSTGFYIVGKDLKSYISRVSKEPAQPSKWHNEPEMAVRLLQSLLPLDKSRQNIIGDLLEEFSEFESKTTSYLWLYKQILKSVLPLAYEAVKNRLASYFGERIR